MRRNIEFFEKTNGSCPVEDFLDGLKIKTRQKALAVFELVESLPSVPKKFFKKLVGTSGIWEIRIEHNSNIYRVLCFFQKNNLVVLTHGFQKKSQKTPGKEIELAEKYKTEYLARRKSS